MGKAAFLIYPHQLFRRIDHLNGTETIYLIEDPLLFTQYRFHKQKLVLHRASMKAYEKFLSSKAFLVKYVESSELKETGDIAEILRRDEITDVGFVDPVDYWLETRLIAALDKIGVRYTKIDSPMFLNSSAETSNYFGGKETFSMAAFYERERKRRGILMSESGKPVGGRYSLDAENRKKLPKKLALPHLKHPSRTPLVDEAITYVDKRFAENYGDAAEFHYPTTFAEADDWLDDFLKNRFADFGPYEDAIAKYESTIFHSVLSPMLNTGLLTPAVVVTRVLAYAEERKIPLNSIEGFIRQVIGWREFIRGVYVSIGRSQRTANFWNANRRLPDSFWSGTTGIEPLDDTIRKVLRTAYSHHIERLMIVGNFMMLCEIDPHDAYLWFMEMYIDAYDWVMVPNVYGMSLQSDGGSIVTKPYISGSNYILKMSDYKKGEWARIWDGLYWRFIAKHEEFFLSNYRLSMMPRLLAKMDASKREQHINTAENFLKDLR